VHQLHQEPRRKLSFSLSTSFVYLQLLDGWCC
jgi:hypothetical protein